MGGDGVVQTICVLGRKDAKDCCDFLALENQ